MYMINKLVFLFLAQSRICFWLSMFLNYLCTSLPTITLDNREYTVHVKKTNAIIYFALYSVAYIFIWNGKIWIVCIFIAGVAILSNAPERLPEKKKPERGERERSRGHGSGGTNNPGSHGSSRQVSYETCIMFSYFIV